MISIRSVIGALRKTLKICESVLVRKVDVSGTSKGGIGGWVCAIEICLTFGLIDRPSVTGGTRCPQRVCQSHRQQRCRFEAHDETLTRLEQ
jgi:hypothetical protein